jgi:hypothetical protein
VIKLTQDIDYVYMFLIAAGMGAIGGLGAELLLKRAGNTGTIAMPHHVKGTNLVDLGFPASLVIGAIAAVAAIYFFPPIVEKITVLTNGTAPKTTAEYELVKLIPLSLIVGSAGPAFLSAAQSRLMSALNAQRVGTAVETGKNQVDQIAESAKAAVPAAVRQAVSESLPSTDSETVQTMVDAAAASLEDTLAPQIKVAHEQVEAIGPTPDRSEESASTP